MMNRLFSIVLVAMMVMSLNAFAPSVPFLRTSTASTELFACRVNAKKQKIKRNRENMRKFKRVGKKGTSRRKALKKIYASRERQVEAEFIAKCFLTSAGGEEEKE